MFVFRNNTVENLFPDGTVFSGYDDISTLPVDESQLVWFYQVPIGFSDEQKSEAINSILEKLHFVVSQMQSGQTMIVCELMDLFPTQTVVLDNSIERAISEFNSSVIDLCLENPSVKYIKVSDYFKKFSLEEWINWRFYFISQMIVSPALAKGFVDWFERKAKQIYGGRKKCLVLDLDNTLWGGILGEDGIDGIKIGGDYPGNAFLYFQESLIELSKKGVILAICSKNNEADVLEAWEKNPFIKLKSDVVASYRINWNNKADNIREIAKELNIGLDSMVFVDDNPSERELVKQELPMVEVPDFPKKPYGLMTLYSTLLSDYFLAYQLTEEDKAKTDQYKANAKRALESRQFTDLTEFIKSLDIHIDIIPADKFNIHRIAQMTMKTNQFNLTTKRYSESDIQSFIDNGDKVWCISVNDKFGDNGITGAIIVRMFGQKAKIDTLLLSCRILGKGIEDAFFKSVLNKLMDEGVGEIESEYIRTAKNGMVSDFYKTNGMIEVDNSGDMKHYKLSLETRFDVPEYYNINFI